MLFSEERRRVAFMVAIVGLIVVVVLSCLGLLLEVSENHEKIEAIRQKYPWAGRIMDSKTFRVALCFALFGLSALDLRQHLGDQDRFTVNYLSSDHGAKDGTIRELRDELESERTRKSQCPELSAIANTTASLNRDSIQTKTDLYNGVIELSDRLFKFSSKYQSLESAQFGSHIGSMQGLSEQQQKDLFAKQGQQAVSLTNQELTEFQSTLWADVKIAQETMNLRGLKEPVMEPMSFHLAQQAMAGNYITGDSVAYLARYLKLKVKPLHPK